MENEDGKSWKIIKQNIRETILLEDWALEDYKSDKNELGIFKKLDLSSLIIPKIPSKTPRTWINSPTIFTPPPMGFVKLNFYGASKGNPIQTIYRAIFYDWEGRALNLYTSNYGITDNNVAEFLALEMGLILDKNEG